MTQKGTGQLEMLIFAALVARPRGSYGVEIADRIERQTGKGQSIGAVYTVLGRLESAGFVESNWGEPTAERGGRRRRYYILTAAGERAFRENQDAHRAALALAGAVV